MVRYSPSLGLCRLKSQSLKNGEGFDATIRVSPNGNVKHLDFDCGNITASIANWVRKVTPWLRPLAVSWRGIAMEALIDVPRILGTWNMHHN
jgi:hypothetical protein